MTFAAIWRIWVLYCWYAAFKHFFPNAAPKIVGALIMLVTVVMMTVGIWFLFGMTTVMAKNTAMEHRNYVCESAEAAGFTFLLGYKVDGITHSWSTVCMGECFKNNVNTKNLCTKMYNAGYFKLSSGKNIWEPKWK